MTTKAKLDLKLVLPDVDDQHDACLERLRDLLQAKRGVERSHVLATVDRSVGYLCVHFDQDLVSLQDLRHFAQQAGLQLQASYGHLKTDIEPLPERRARSLARSLQNEEGILEAVISGDGSVRVEFDREQIDDESVHSHIERLSGVAEHADDEAHAHGGIFGERTELIFVALCGVALLLGWLLPKLVTVPEWIPLSVLVAAYFFGGWFTVKEAWANLRSGRFEIDTLMLVAAAGAAALGAWEEGALLLFLFSLGHALEAYAMGRAKRAIEALGELAPRTATVRRDGTVQEVAVENLRIGDVVLVKPNARLPADGFVSDGESSVNQAPITGESVPVDKFPVSDEAGAATNPDQLDAAHRVFAGSINGGGALEIHVTRIAADSTLARVVEMVRNAETQQSPTQQFTDRFERIFVPVVIAGAVLAM
ncbi:MAG: heavy metal translocating P-type ATPase, partial [Gammaproteobacteria bacterium]|nr:heavy metal translocating P-type ATPase [Gammaproteobacteria bacterium]MBU1832068.1 heavy metal translocating P-type ATPase [Gammaproteobacteria bacterium]